MTKTTTRVSLCAAAAVLLAIAQPSPAMADAEVDRIMAKFDHEPTIREVQVAAIKYYNVDPGRISSLRSRARGKALIPSLTVGFTNALSSYSTAIDDIIFRQQGVAVFEDQNADFIGFSASASWSLDRLVFNVEELDVMSLIGIQDGIQREVTALYYVRRRLQIQLLLKPPASIEGRISAQLRMEELTGLLDAYTGGYFSKRIASAKGKSASMKRPYGTFALTDKGAPKVETVVLPGMFRNMRTLLRMRMKSL